MPTALRALICCALLLPFWAGSAQAADPAGEIKKSRGQATIERGSQVIQAQVGTPVFPTDKLRTGADGRVGLALRDGTLLSAGPNSLITLEQFRYDARSDAGAMAVGVNKGSLAVATGKIAKKTPESVDFHTPTTVLGVRGTEFLISVDGD